MTHLSIRVMTKQDSVDSLFCLDQGIKAPEDPIKVTLKMEILVSVNYALACFKFASLTFDQSGHELQNSEKIFLLVQSILLRYLEFKAHRKYYSNFNFTIFFCFCLCLCYPFD